MRVSDIARTWGVSPGYVSRLVKRGMPTGSLAEADSWRLANLQKPPRSPSGAASVKVAAGVEAKGEALAEGGDESPEARLKRAQQAEILAYGLLRQLAEGGNAVSLRAGVHAFGEAQRRCSEAELHLAKHRQATLELIPAGEAQEVFTKYLGGLRALMDQLPASAAVRANPSDPECAKKALEEAINQILRAIQKAEDDKPFPTPSEVFGVSPLPTARGDS